MSDKSILLRLQEAGQPARQLDLRGTERGEDLRARYALLGEIARGGVGVVHHGRDNDLGRDVALKVLREEYLANPDLIRRFVEEAQIGAQLQHPGIVPVYELGLDEEQRPYFAMKLVKGQTLAERLAERRDPGDGRRNLLAIFREACRTVAYAHARCVIHRDLKPANIMIGSFGEVQVVDWGFAKILQRGGIADERLAKHTERLSTIIETAGSDPSVAGSVMGTPAYMPPEQALGHVDDLDARSDVFALGAILCEILTGKPPFADVTDAAQGKLVDAHVRLDGCGADDALVDLCRRALAPLPKDRPPHAQTVAEEIAAYLAKAEGRAHRAAKQAANAGARARQQQRAKTFTRAIVAAGLLAVLLVGGTFLWIEHDRTERDRRRAASIATAVREASRAREAGDLDTALAAAERARDLGGDVEQLVADVHARRDAVARDEFAAALIQELSELEIKHHGVEYSAEEVDAERVALLAEHGLALDAIPERFRGSPHARELAASLDNWAVDRKTFELPDSEALFATARALDPQDNEIRAAFASKERLTRLADPKRVAEMSPLHIAMATAWLSGAGRVEEAAALGRAGQRRYPGHFWVNYHLAGALQRRKPREAVRYLAAAQALKPHSLEVAHQVGWALAFAGDLRRSVAHWRTMLKRHPGWAHGWAHLAQDLGELGERKEAREAVEEGLAVGRDYKLFLVGAVLDADAGDYEAGLAKAQEAAKEKPEFARPTLAYFLAQLGKFDEAEAELAKAEKAFPRWERVWIEKARVHLLKGEAEAAEQAARRATEVNDRHFESWKVLAAALEEKQNYEEALKMRRKAVALAPYRGAEWANLSTTLRRAGKLDEALAAAEQASELDPAYGAWSLAAAHFKKREYERALEAIDQAIHFRPKRWDNHFFRAQILEGMKRLKDAAEAFEKSAEFATDKTYAEKSWSRAAHWYSGVREHQAALDAANRTIACGQGTGHGQRARALLGLKRYEDALKAAIELYVDKTQSPVDNWLAFDTVLQGFGDHVLTLAAVRQAVKADPKSTRALGRLASLLLFQERNYADALEVVSRLLALKRDDPSAWYVKGAALEGLGKGEQAFSCFLEMAEICKTPDRWVKFGRRVLSYPALTWLAWYVGRFDMMRASFERGLREPKPDPRLHYYRGVYWSERGKPRVAADAFEAVIRAGGASDAWDWLGKQLLAAGKLEQARARLRACPDPKEVRYTLERAELYLSLEPDLARIVSGERAPDDAGQALDFAWLCHYRAEHAAATRLFREGGDEIPPKFAARSAVLSDDREQALAWLRDYLKQLGEMKRPTRLRKLEQLKLEPVFTDLPALFWRELDRLIQEDRRAR